MKGYKVKSYMLIGYRLIWRAVLAPRLPLQFGEGRGEVNWGEIFSVVQKKLCETPTRQVSSVALCGKKSVQKTPNS